jgi:hypothetical protein
MAFTAAEVHGRTDEFQRRVPRVGERLQLTPQVGGHLRGDVSLREEVGLVEPKEGSRIARNTISNSFYGVIDSPTHGNEFDTEVAVESITSQRIIVIKIPVIPPTNARGEGSHVGGRVVSISDSTLTAADGDISWNGCRRRWAPTRVRVASTALGRKLTPSNLTAGIGFGKSTIPLEIFDSRSI